jgi:hypothetical protein
MLRVGALDQTINFHEKTCGMKLLIKSYNPSYEYTIAMLDMLMRKETTFLELTYNYGVNKYSRGNDHGVNKYNRGNEQQFAAFKDISAQFRNGDIGARKAGFVASCAWACKVMS